jgi:alpha-glucosidase
LLQSVGGRADVRLTDPATSFGFSSSSDRPSSPWLPQPGDWGTYSVAAQQHDPDSMLSLYHHLLSARRSRLDPDAGLAFVDVEHPDLLMLRRGDVTVVLNVGESELDLVSLVPSLADAEVVISSAPGHADAGRLPANTCCWLAPA